jgi:photosystem II stability/assembly factor-like uncharacterized protein
VSKEQIQKYIYHAVFRVIITLVIFACFGTFISVPRVSAAEAAKWARVNIPAEGEAGGWTLANGSDIRHLALAPDGTMYAYGAGLPCTLLKSTDGGRKWSGTGQVQDEITGIAVSPYDSNLLYYTTASSVYRSGDAGKNFRLLPAPGGAGAGNIEITSVSAVWLNNSVIAVATRDTDSAEYGGVYILDEAEIIPSWADTGIGNYDVYAVAFAPGYASYRQISAVVTDETDSFVFSKYSNAEWNAFSGAAKLNQNNAAAPSPVNTGESAVIVFPDNYSGEVGSAECFFYAGINSGAGVGDVYKITCVDAPSASLAADLNIGGFNAPDIDVTGLALHGNNDSLILLAGASAESRTYTSTDGGVSWTKSRKPPTGGGDTGVFFSPDFDASGIMYAATAGNGSAVSVSDDSGSTWNQVSLIDTTIDNIIDIAVSPDYYRDNTLFLLTFGNNPGSTGLWRTADGGLCWERIFSGTNPGVDILSRISLPPEYGADCRTIFVSGENGGNPVIWSSDDNGRTYRSRVSRNPVNGSVLPADAWVIEDKNTLYIGSYDGAQSRIYKTVNGGLSFTEGAPAGTVPLYAVALSPDYANDRTIIAGGSTGTVYFSNDGGGSFSALPLDTDTALLSGCIDVAFSPVFKENGLIYVSSSTLNAGFFRYDIRRGGEWESIDSSLPANAAIVRLGFADGGILYGINSAAGGGMERCLLPGSSGPVFEKLDLGLSAGAVLSCLRQAGNCIWAADTANCKLMACQDTLNVPVVQNSPANGISGIGSMVDNQLINITISWATLEGATGYEWQCAYDRAFSSVPAGLEDTVTGSSVRLPALEPATVYYWRVRAYTPVLGPWSEEWSFTTGLNTQVIELRPESPAPGALDVPVKPVFQWTAVIGASSYELLLSRDGDFTDPVIIKENDYALPANAWECDVNLDYSTTYYWKIRAVTESTHSIWSSTGVFTTAPLPLIDNRQEGTPEIRLLESQNPMLLPAPSYSAAPLTPAARDISFPSVPPSVPPAVTSTIFTVVAGPAAEVPQWVVYFITGLLAIVMLALIIIFTVIIKIKRF